MKKLLLYSGFLALLGACGNGEKPTKPVSGTTVKTVDYASVKIPAFQSDTAYGFIETQVNFGPRVPGSPGHQKCGQWLVQTMKRFTPHVLIQETKATAYTGAILPLKNIMARWNPEAKERIVFFAHWDTRHRADHDPNQPEKPILGADDGASGVGVLLEIMRVLSADTAVSQLGVDVVLFDGEDYGEEGGAPETYCLGAQYWAKNPHIPGYSAKYGILLDMVGAKDAVFMKEGYSVQYASHVVEKVWSIAHELGYGRFFNPQRSMSMVTDDHYFVNRDMGLPTIDIINYLDSRPKTGFPGHWHTHQDNMDIIDRQTLQAVGHTLLTLIYRENYDL